MFVFLDISLRALHRSCKVLFVVFYVAGITSNPICLECVIASTCYDKSFAFLVELEMQFSCVTKLVVGEVAYFVFLIYDNVYIHEAKSFFIS